MKASRVAATSMRYSRLYRLPSAESLNATKIREVTGLTWCAPPPPHRVESLGTSAPRQVQSVPLWSASPSSRRSPARRCAAWVRLEHARAQQIERRRRPRHIGDHQIERACLRREAHGETEHARAGQKPRKKHFLHNLWGFDWRSRRELGHRKPNPQRCPMSMRQVQCIADARIDRYTTLRSGTYAHEECCVVGPTSRLDQRSG